MSMMFSALAGAFAVASATIDGRCLMFVLLFTIAAVGTKIYEDTNNS